ncbi:2-amino-4-hydroxy-6-hydroxymethyldihydropteridine diphosphokinase [Dongia rigui]|uniref:2-amino-4-hydroxy-6-hydroxymethyldihydropteridine pyrophosphokinase n=1 Tax=Dongia rigui TaxID=940149 RepID=A0ABU5DZ28_9PROT|nr:2-amino-4-hydroxy-6-hydroxymethyldihydropteridine diphosphokinase [Dongia rigui]MDY0872535.1 2-amino-4-hydroxy-6-hydroxymethyldihydropteridine diphosphokinase [Dongia rigui]
MTEGIFIGLGANLPSDAGSPVATLEKAVTDIASAGITIRRRSPWFETAPVPRAADQPWYVNGVIAVASDLGPQDLLALLQRLEAGAGRVRSVANAARPLDLDIIAYGDRVETAADPLLPHPRMAMRAFVLLPLQAIAPRWRHPVSGRSVADLIAALPPDQEIRLL